MNKHLIRIVVAALSLGCVQAHAQTTLTEFRCSTAGGTNCSGLIPDGPQTIGLVATVPVTETTCVGGVRTIQARLDISHDWVGDLRVTLTNPAATSVTILDDIAGPVGSIGGCEGDDVNAVIASTGVLPNCSGQIPAVSGNVRSFASMAPLGGPTIAGTWTLSVFDDTNDNQGVLNDWSVIAACTNATPLPGPRSTWLLVALCGIAAMGSLVVLRRA